MRLCVLSPALPRPDPADAVGEYAQRLAAEHGFDVTLAITEPPPGGLPARLGAARVAPIAEALAGSYDIAIAAGWRATIRLFEIDAARHASFVQTLEHHDMGSWQAERIAAAISYDLPVDFIAAGPGVAALLRDLRPDARCEIVRTGVAKDVFAPGPERNGGVLRVAVAEREAGGGGLARMTELHQAVVIGTGADAPVRAAALALADVALTPRSTIEALHAGTACVVAPAGAHEPVEHMRNGIVVAPDDTAAAARALDLLARDRGLLAELHAGALATAADWPSLETACAQLAAVVERLVAEPPPAAPARWPVRLMADATAAVAVFTNDIQETSLALRRIEDDRAYLMGLAAREALQRSAIFRVLRRGRAIQRRLTAGR